MGLVQEVIPSTERCEVIRSGRASATKRLPVTELLHIAQPTGDPAVAVGVERVEVQRDAGVAAGVHLRRGQNRVEVLVDHLGWQGGVGVDEEAALVGLVVSFHIPITQRELEGCLVRALATKLGGSCFDGGVDGPLDLADRLPIALGDDEADGALGLGALDGLRLEKVCVGQADFAGDNASRIGVHDGRPPWSVVGVGEICSCTDSDQCWPLVGFGNESGFAFGLDHQLSERLGEGPLAHEEFHGGDADQALVPDVRVAGSLRGLRHRGFIGVFADGAAGDDLETGDLGAGLDPSQRPCFNVRRPGFKLRNLREHLGNLSNGELGGWGELVLCQREIRFGSSAASGCDAAELTPRTGLVVALASGSDLGDGLDRCLTPGDQVRGADSPGLDVGPARLEDRQAHLTDVVEGVESCQGSSP